MLLKYPREAGRRERRREAVAGPGGRVVLLSGVDGCGGRARRLGMVYRGDECFRLGWRRFIIVLGASRVVAWRRG